MGRATRHGEGGPLGEVRPDVASRRALAAPTLLRSEPSSLPASPIRRLAPLAAAAKARGTHVYQLNIGQPDLQLPGPFREAIQKSEVLHLDYTPSDGEPATREAIATFLKSRGFSATKAADLIVCNGGSEALLLTFRHVETLATLPLHHADPFDRMLIAQAIAEDMTILTSDERFAEYSARVQLIK